MDIGRISQNFNNTTSIQGTGAANPLIQRDSFTKSGVSGSIDKTTNITGISPQLASGILFSGKKASDLTDPFALKSEGLQAWSGTYDTESGSYFAGLVKGSGDDKKCFLSSFNPDGSLKWKVPMEKPVYDMIPDKQGGVVVRQWNRVFSYDKNGKESWDFTLPNSNQSYNSLPVTGPDNTIFYTTGNTDSSIDGKNMSIVAIKDGKLKWTYRANNQIFSNIDILVTKQGNVFFTTEEKKKPESLLQKLFPPNEKTHYLVCLNPDGTKKFETEVIPNDYGSNHAIEGSNGNIFYLSDKGKSLNAMTPEGESLWTFSGENISHSPVADGKGNIYITTGFTLILHDPPESSVICIDEKTGEKKWERKFERGIETEPLLTDNGIALKVTKTFETGSEPGFIQLNEKGADIGFLKETAGDGDGLVYLNNNHVVTRSGGKYILKPFMELNRINPGTAQDLTGTKAGETGKIEVKEKSVVIGGVTLKRGKFSGIFGHWF